MSPEERDELIHFILQSQSNAAEAHRKISEDHQKIMEGHQKFAEEHRTIMEGHQKFAEEHQKIMEEHREATKQMAEHDVKLYEVRAQIEALAVISHDLVEVERIHSRRLDRLENPNL